MEFGLAVMMISLEPGPKMENLTMPFSTVTRIFYLFLVLTVVIVGSGADAAFRNSGESGVPDCSEITEQNADDCIRLNQIQVLGTHNSYHLAPEPALVDALDAHNPGWADNIQYSHHPIQQQLDELGIRQLELDIFADPEGGLYARPLGAVIAGSDDYINQPEMHEPGYKVLHIQDIDYRSTCLTLLSCMTEIRDWSLENPNHFPILVLIEVKDGTLPDRDTLSFTVPVPVDEELIGIIDEEIWSVFSSDHVITPDDVRRDFSSLEEAILTRGWPTVGESRGQILFALDNTGTHRDAYLSRAPDLGGSAMFVSSAPGHPTAGFIKMNDAIGDRDLIAERVAAGYLIRTRSDIPVQEARTGDTTRREAALSSGAQFVSTDYPEPSPFGSGYIVELPEATGPARCNPVNAPAGCQNNLLTE